MFPALATTSLDFAAVLASASIVRALIAPETLPLLSRLPEASAVTDTTVSTAGGEAVTTGPDVHVCAWERREGARASGGAVLGAAGGLTSLLDEIDRYGLKAGRSSRSCPVRTGDSRRTSPQSATSPGILNTGADSQEVHLGGHLVGVYVLLKYGINAQNFVASEALMRSMISDLLPERLRAPIV